MPSATLSGRGRFRAEKKVPVLEMMEFALEDLGGLRVEVETMEVALLGGREILDGEAETMLSGRRTEETRLGAALMEGVLPFERLRVLFARLALCARRAYSSGDM